MRRARGENAHGCLGGADVVQPVEHLYQQDVEDVAGSSGGARRRAGVQFLCHLLGQAQTANGRGDRQTQFGQTGNLRIYKIDRLTAGGTEIDFDGLPSAGAIGDRDVYANGVYLIHIPDLGFEPERKGVKTQGNRALKQVHTGTARPFEAEIEVLRRPGAIRKAELERSAPFQEVRAENPLFQSAFENTTKS